MGRTVTAVAVVAAASAAVLRQAQEGIDGMKEPGVLVADRGHIGQRKGDGQAIGSHDLLWRLHCWLHHIV